MLWLGLTVAKLMLSPPCPSMYVPSFLMFYHGKYHITIADWWQTMSLYFMYQKCVCQLGLDNFTQELSLCWM